MSDSFKLKHSIWIMKWYLALPRFNLRRIRTSGVSPGKELPEPSLAGDDLDKLANPIDATERNIHSFSEKLYFALSFL